MYTMPRRSGTAWGTRRRASPRSWGRTMRSTSLQDTFTRGKFCPTKGGGQTRRPPSLCTSSSTPPRSAPTRKSFDGRCSVRGRGKKTATTTTMEGQAAPRRTLAGEDSRMAGKPTATGHRCRRTRRTRKSKRAEGRSRGRCKKMTTTRRTGGSPCPTGPPPRTGKRRPQWSSTTRRCGRCTPNP